MTTKNQIIRNLSDAIKASGEKKAKGYFAMLGNLAGEVLTGVPNLVYVTTFEGQTRTVINRRVPNDVGSVVFVGTDDYSANRIEVLYSLSVNGVTNDGEVVSLEQVPPHSHGYDSLNPSWIQSAQFLPLLVLPYSGQTVQAYPGMIRTSSGGLKWFAGEIVDLSGYYPVSGAVWVTIEIEDDGTTTVVSGIAAAARADLDETDVPAEDTGKRIIAIILEDGYTELFRNNVRNDFLDLRFFALESGGASDAADVTYTPAALADWDYLSDPGDVADGLDQLAERITDIETGETPAGSQYRLYLHVDDGAGSFDWVTVDGRPVTALYDLE